MRPGYIYIMVQVSHLLPIRKVAPWIGYPHYLFPYCQLVCHVLLEATELYAAGQQSTYKFQAGATVNRFGKQPMRAFVETETDEEIDL